MFTNVIYTKSPIAIQNIMLSARALFRKLLRENSSSETLFNELLAHEVDSELLENFIQTSLKKTLRNASSTTEFYNGCANTNPDLNDFPYISKQDILNNPNCFKSNVTEKLIINGSTSGTTGTPLPIPQNMNSVIREQAFIKKSLHWAGFQKGDKRAWLRGDLLVPIEQKAVPFWRYSYFENMILLSSFHLNQAALPLYIKAIIFF